MAKLGLRIVDGNMTTSGRCPLLALVVFIIVIPTGKWSFTYFKVRVGVPHGCSTTVSRMQERLESLLSDGQASVQVRVLAGEGEQTPSPTGNVGVDPPPGMRECLPPPSEDGSIIRRVKSASDLSKHLLDHAGRIPPA
jgi:hypothetical protein